MPAVALGVAAGSSGEGGTMTLGVLDDMGGSEARGVPYLLWRRLRCTRSMVVVGLKGTVSVEA